MSQVQKNDAQIRVLMVLEEVLRNGPLTIEELKDRLSISQSACYRALQHLVSYGWLQPAALGKGYVASTVLHDVSDHARYGFPYIDDAKLVHKTVKKLGNIELKLALLRQSGRVDLVDTSDKLNREIKPLRVTQSFLGRAAICALPPQEKVVFLRRYLALADEKERASSKTVNFASLFNFDGPHQILMDPMQAKWAFAFRAKDGTVGAMQMHASASRFGTLRTLFKGIHKVMDLQDTGQLNDIEFLVKIDELKI
ncbi:MAG: winged helix-turn-helix transcriptional regulator [Planktomarina sp.]